MRMILMFDLPMKTKKERHIYTTFRKFLLKRGFFALQFSVYSKIFANRDAAINEKEVIRKVVPEKGNIRIMIVTEKQYANIEIIIGGKSNQEKLITEEVLLILWWERLQLKTWMIKLI